MSGCSDDFSRYNLLPLDLAIQRNVSDADFSALLIRPFIRREAVLSSRIEGTQADLNDLYAYEAGRLALPGLKSAAPESDVREVLNYVHALEYGLERVNTFPVSLRLKMFTRRWCVWP